MTLHILEMALPSNNHQNLTDNPLLNDNTSMSNSNHTSFHYPVPNTLQLVIMWTAPILMILLNILVFVVAPRMKSIRPCTGYGMVSLALADFFLGIVHLIRLSFNTYTNYQLEESHPVCILDGYGQALFASISIATLTFLNLDRLLTICFPLRYPRHLSKLRVKLVHLAIWTFMIILLSPTITGATGTRIKYYENAFMCVPDWAGSLPYNLVILVLVEIVPTGVILVCFVGIFLLARKKNKLLRNNSNVHVHGGSRENLIDSQWKRDLRIFRTLAIMTFGFYIAWSPYFITVAIPEMIVGHSLHPITDFIGPWLGASNSFWNPFIYIPTMKPFSTALFALLAPLCGPCKKTKCVCGKVVRGQTPQCDCGGGAALSSSNSATGSTALSKSNASANVM